MKLISSDTIALSEGVTAYVDKALVVGGGAKGPFGSRIYGHILESIYIFVVVLCLASSTKSIYILKQYT
jgi:hypothetical protein